MGKKEDGERNGQAGKLTARIVCDMINSESCIQCQCRQLQLQEGDDLEEWSKGALGSGMGDAAENGCNSRIRGSSITLAQISSLSERGNRETLFSRLVKRH